MRLGIYVPIMSLAVYNTSARQADCLIIVTCEYNHTLPPGLTNMMNYFGGSVYSYKPSGICSYSAGMWGGARAAVAARAYLSELGCLSVSATMQVLSGDHLLRAFYTFFQFQVPQAWKAFDEDGALKSEMQTKSCNR